MILYVSEQKWATVSVCTHAGFQGMDDNEMMKSVMDGISASTVPEGMVRRKKEVPSKSKKPLLASTSKGFGAR